MTTLPSALAHADLARLDVTPLLDPATRSKLGQFLTPAPVAAFIAAMFPELPEEVRLLDAGAGVGTLTAAFVREACSRATRPRSIAVTAFEVDALLADRLAVTMENCEEECRHASVAFTWEIVKADYITHSAAPLQSEPGRSGRFTCAILNPPYLKINTNSATRRALSSQGIETTNLYSAFVALALQQLAPHGQLVAITPRSFCNGVYFEPFRRLILELSAIHQVHVYGSRTQAFKDDEVLQENIVYRLGKNDPQPDMVCLSSSEGPQAKTVTKREVAFAEIVLPGDRHCFIRLPVSSEEGELAQRVRALPCTLAELGIKVSTGRVIDFRAKEHLHMLPGEDTAPLIYPNHFDRGFVSWPKLEGRKPNALASNAETATMMVPRGTYVLTKRFTSKEEKRRLVAVIYDGERMTAPVVGFENHLNYFHLGGRGLPSALARGLALFLNSTAVDDYFRQFSGHTQVNATDLRNLNYPRVEQLLSLGARMGSVIPSQEEIDEWVEALL